MRFIVILDQVHHGDVRIFLRVRYARMPQALRDRDDITAVLHQYRSERINAFVERD